MSEPTDLYIARAAKNRRETERTRERNTRIVNERILGGKLEELARFSTPNRAKEAS